MTLKLMKILVSLLVVNHLKKNDEGSDDPEYNPKFLHWNSSKSCKYWKQLQKAYVPIVQNHIEDFVSTL